MISGKCYIEHRWQKEFLQNNHKRKKNDPWVIKEITMEVEHSLRNTDLINQKQASVNTNEALEIIQSRKDRRTKGNVGNTRALGRHHSTWVMDNTRVMERCVSCGCSRTKRKAELFLKREQEQQMCQ